MFIFRVSKRQLRMWTFEARHVPTAVVCNRLTVSFRYAGPPFLPVFSRMHMPRLDLDLFHRFFNPAATVSNLHLWGFRCLRFDWWSYVAYPASRK